MYNNQRRLGNNSLAIMKIQSRPYSVSSLFFFAPSVYEGSQQYTNHPKLSEQICFIVTTQKEICPKVFLITDEQYHITYSPSFPFFSDCSSMSATLTIIFFKNVIFCIIYFNCLP